MESKAIATMYEAMDRFNSFELTAEEFLSVLHECYKTAETKQDREAIKEYSVLISNRIAKNEIK